MPRSPDDASPLRVVIADDHATFRRALRTALSADPRIEVVADAPDLRAARLAVIRHRADALVVDADIVEAEHGVLGPIPAGLIVVVAGMDDAPGLSARAQRQGATGYVAKDDSALLVKALLSAPRGTQVNEPTRARGPARPPGLPARRPEPSFPPRAGPGRSSPR